eukprot:12927755-Prorocentrum_lima.AAC.1
MQQALENKMLAEQNLQTKMLIESISTHVREQQRAQESHLRMLHGVPQGASSLQEGCGHHGRKKFLLAGKD